MADHLIREEETPSRQEQARAALALCGKYSDRDGPSRVARDHDRHLAEAYRR